MFSTFMIGGTWRRNRFRISGFLTSCHLLREVLEHLDGLLEAAELPGAHGEPPPDVDHYVRVPPVLRFHESVLVLELLAPPVVRLGDPEGLAELGLGLGNVQRLLLLRQQDVGSGALRVQPCGDGGDDGGGDGVDATLVVMLV